MSKIAAFFACLFFTFFAVAQEMHTVNGEQLAMETEVDGTLGLYVSKAHGEYRYFVSKAGVFYELTNTKDASGTYTFEYKDLLEQLTSDATLTVSVKKTGLTISSLKKVVIDYNTQKDSSYTYENKHFKLGANLGFLAGVSNNVFTTNEANAMAPQIIGELEFFDALKPESGHSAFFHLKQTFEAEEYQYTATQLSVNYRYKVVNKEAFKLYGQTKLATLTYSKVNYTATTDGVTYEVKDDGFSLDFPVLFGVGTDIKIGENLMLTFQYNDVVALFLDANGEFPVDFNLGVKFGL